jgi:hypothetical protein
MRNLGTISIEQVFALIAVNVIGLVFMGLIFFLMRGKSPNPTAKLLVSVRMGLIMVILLAVVSGDLGIYLWIDSGNFQAMTLAIPLIICGSPFVFLVVIMGTYVQLIYRDKIQRFVDAHKR